MSSKTPIREIMSLEVKYCFEDVEMWSTMSSHETWST